MHVPVRARRSRRVASAAIALGLTAGLAYCATPRHPVTTATPRTAPAASSTRLSAARASAQARATGQAVVADALTTQTSQTTANPNGSFTLTTSPAPVRVARDGAWVSLDATLARNTDGTYSPAATPTGLALSGGGSGPLAVLTDHGRQLSVSLPVTLPAPTVSGASATYPNVLPDVDLVVSATALGGYSDVFVVKTAAAAANPDLSTLMTSHLAGAGVNLSTDAVGNLTAATPAGTSVFTAPAAAGWDSATTSTTPGVDRSTGAALTSTVAGPGEGAHQAPLDATLTGGTLTLNPPASLLTGSTTDYPVFLDPSVGPSVAFWTMTNSLYPTTSYFGSGTAHRMQVGYQGWQSPTFTAHSFTTLDLSTVPTGAVVSSAQVNFWEDTAPSCTATQVDLYQTGPITSSTTWNHEPAWGAFIGGKSVAKGYPGCTPGGVGWDIGPQVTTVLSGGGSTLTLGLKADDETDKNEWKQFNGNVPGETPTNAQVTYDLYPDTPSGLYTSPSTDCATTTLGDTAVNLYAPVFTRTGVNLTTTFTLYKTTDNSRTNLLTPANNIPSDTYSGPSGQPAVMALPETFLKTLAGSTATSFSWQAQSTDGNLTSDWSGACVFAWDSSRPGAPGVTATANPTTGSTCPLAPAKPAYQVGTLCSFTLTPPNKTTISGYLYQLNQSPPVTVTATGTATITLTLPRIVNTLTVTALSPGGNVGSVTKVTADAASITPPAKDGDLTNDHIPDLIIPGTTTANSNVPAGLWLATGKSDDTLTPAMTNIGTTGLGFSSPPTATDWNGAQTITGDYCGLGAQDVLAYVPGATTPANPNGGGGAVVCSDGSTSPLHPLNPTDGSAYSLNPQTFQDSGANATQIAGGGTQNFTDATAPVFLFYGTVTTSAGTSQLDAFGMPSDQFGQALPIDLATQPTPTGGADWNNWTITTTQLATGIAMYLWNPTTGDLYLWTAVALNSTTFEDATGITYTQNKIAAGWHTGTSHLLLRAAGINADAIPDLWAVNTAPGTALTATAYLPTTLTDNPPLTTTATNLFTSSHAWPLQDIGTNTTGSPVTTSSDIVGGLNLTATTGATWNTNDLFSPDITLNGSTATLTTTGAAVTPNADFTLSAWVKPTLGGGSILSQDGTNDSSFTVSLTADGHWQIAMNNNATTTASYDTDTGTTAALGAWTQLTLSYNTTGRTLALYTGGTLSAALNATAPPTTGGPLRIGAQQTNSAITGYYTGQIATVQTWNSVVTTPITPALGTLGDVTGDTKPDLLAIDPSGNLLLYPNTGGTGITTFGANGPTQVGSGWSGFTLDAVADLTDPDHSRRAGLLATDPAGNLLYYPNTGGTGLGTFDTPTQVGTGWNVMRIIGLTDLHSDGADGILTIDTTDATLLYYPHTSGTGTGTFGTPTQVGSSWTSNLTAVVGDIDNNTTPDLLALDTSGNLSLYPNTGNTGVDTFAAPTQVGTGLSGYKLTALSDPYATGRNGYITVNTANGNLYYTPNTGSTGLNTFGTPTLIGTGWNPYTIN